MQSLRHRGTMMNSLGTDEFTQVQEHHAIKSHAPKRADRATVSRMETTPHTSRPPVGAPTACQQADDESGCPHSHQGDDDVANNGDTEITWPSPCSPSSPAYWQPSHNACLRISDSASVCCVPARCMADSRSCGARRKIIHIRFVLI